MPLAAPRVLNTSWALVFKHDRLYTDRPFRTLIVLDEGDREVLAIGVVVSRGHRQMIGVLDQLVAQPSPHRLR